MKRLYFECSKCDTDNDGSCKFSLPKIAINDRDDLIDAMRRCPLESSNNGKFTGKVPRAKWNVVKGGD